MLVLMRVLGLCGLLYGGWQGCMNDGHVFGRGMARVNLGSESWEGMV